MAKNTERVAGRVPEELKDKLATFCEREGIGESEAVRLLLEESLDSRRISGTTQRLVVYIPHADVDIIDQLQDVGEAENREEAVKFAVKLWCETKVSQYSSGFADFERGLKHKLEARAERKKREEFTDKINVP